MTNRQTSFARPFSGEKLCIDHPPSHREGHDPSAAQEVKGVHEGKKNNINIISFNVNVYRDSARKITQTRSPVKGCLFLSFSKESARC